jgi:2-dehydro-3-deoxyphosphogluconate aldolase / (4S)-4-hydroxy-2-oxoglutarate aldolase
MQTMRSREQIISMMTNPGIIVIFRTDEVENVLPACEALIAGGITALEVTLTMANALATIRDLSQKLSARAVIGAGSVISPENCRSAIEAGAEFIVTPVMKPEIVKAAHAADKPIVLGAFTPTEAQLAHEAGADFVKIFPADIYGARGLKTILAPLPHLKIIPTGGVDLQTIGDFLKAGCAAVGVGSALVGASILKQKNWVALTHLAQEFISAVQKVR